MFKFTFIVSCGLLHLIVSHALAQAPIRFEDVTEHVGLAQYLERSPGHRPWRYAHGAAWGDVDNDGRPDLYIGAFAARAWYSGEQSPIPNWLFRNRADGFEPVDEAAIQFRDGDARCAGALFVDLDQDNDLDLVVTNHVQQAKQRGSRLFENVGAGRFRDATPQVEPWTGKYGMRNVAALDSNNDGRLDLILADGSYGRPGEERAHLFVLENQGEFRFEDVSKRLGLPQENTSGLGLAIGDINNDGALDIFVAGSNRLFVSTLPGQFQEAQPGRFQVPTADAGEGMHCGAALGDLDGDGLLDLVTTEHGVPAQIHVFRNQGIVNGMPDLVEVTKSAGVGQLFPRGTREKPLKTAHVGLCDMDNDGKADIVLTVLFQDEQGRVQPVVLRNLSEQRGELKFSIPPWDQMSGYYAPGPIADYDRDGRLDIFLPSWFEHLPNYLMRNVSAGGHWLTVRVRGRDHGLNGMGVGSVVRVYESGHLGDSQHLIGRRDIVIGTGYASGEEALAHVGLGSHQQCDVRVTWRELQVDQTGVAADQMLEVTVGDKK
jgi:hypothetical protein